MSNITIEPVNKTRGGGIHPFWGTIQTVANRKQNWGKNQILQYFTNSDLRLGHKGLTEVAEKNGITPSELGAGEFILFINRAWTGVKLLTAGNGVFYQKTPGKQTLVPEALALIPKYFNGKQIDLGGAMSEAIRKDFARRETNKRTRK